MLRLDRPDRMNALNTQMVGEYNVANLLAVLGAARAMGFALVDAVRACEGLEPVPGRMQRVAAGESTDPHVRILRIFGPDANVWVKCERANPGGSIKDRIGLSMIEAAEKAGKIKPGDTLVEGTAPEAKKVKPPRTHWDMLLERRTIAELEELLEERLQYLRDRRGKAAKIRERRES